jgi:mRNA interferase MazF
MSLPLPACSRGEIWTLDFEPRRGSEQGGFRPCLILQTDLGNHAPGARTTIVVPLTTQGRPYAFYIPVPKAKGNGLAADSWANCTQLFTVDKSRLMKRLGRANETQLTRIAGAVKMALELG